jgi:phosphoribosylanthranilate isomerase
MNAPQVKICGITRSEQAQLIADAGADALGYILYPPSKRFISPDKVREIVKQTPVYTKHVGVVVNETLDNLEKIYHQSGIDLVQLHGDETIEYCLEADKRNIRWIKAFRVKEDFDFRLLDAWPASSFLLDAWDEQEYGGTGKTLDWKVLKETCDKFQIVLAGGITPSNVKQAIDSCQPAGIDLSSGVESSPGVKDMMKIKDLFQAVRDKRAGYRK